MRPFLFEQRMHGTMLEPWTGPGAWWRSETGEWWSALIITIPVSVLWFLICWIGFQLRRGRHG